MAAHLLGELRERTQLDQRPSAPPRVVAIGDTRRDELLAILRSCPDPTLAYTCHIWHMTPVVPAPDKTLVILSGEIKTPPLSKQARIEAGVLLRRLQRGEVLSMPHSRPMPVVGPRCHELRITDAGTNQTWRILDRTDAREILVVELFSKKTQQTPRHMIDTCIRRLRQWDAE